MKPAHSWSRISPGRLDGTDTKNGTRGGSRSCVDGPPLVAVSVLTAGTLAGNDQERPDSVEVFRMFTFRNNADGHPWETAAI